MKGTALFLASLVLAYACGGDRRGSGDGRTDAALSSDARAPADTAVGDATGRDTGAGLACGEAPRSDPPDSEEICIPAGPFIRGQLGTRMAFGEPVHEINLSAYFIDRFLVTNRRYQECVTAGACSIPTLSEGRDSLANPARADYPVQSLLYADARAFCSWDGGRLLPTEAQWEKAARGPAPRTTIFPWGDEYSCTVLPSEDCGASFRSFAAPDPYDALGATASYYGVEMMIGGGFEIVRDYFAADYYADPASWEDDPTGPATGSYRTIRGAPRRDAAAGLDGTTISRRGYADDEVTPLRVVRCLRIPGGSP